MSVSELIAELQSADAALTTAVQENADFWGWAFNEMTDNQGESLNRLFNAVTALLRAVEAESKERTSS